MNPDFELGAYAKKDEQDKFKVTVHFVRGLHGGAGNAHFDQGSFIKQKKMQLPRSCLLRDVI